MISWIEAIFELFIAHPHLGGFPLLEDEAIPVAANLRDLEHEGVIKVFGTD